MVKKVNLAEALSKVLGFKSDVEGKRNPTKVTADQVGTYEKSKVNQLLANYLEPSDLPINQFGDLGFTPPNISAEYEGAMPYGTPIAYSVEDDGNRNYLRSGFDGSKYGAYLCKYFVNALGKVTGYTPLAIPWRPAYLPDGWRVLGVISAPEDELVVVVTNPAREKFFAISPRNGTLNPAVYTTAKFARVPSNWSIHNSLVFTASDGTVYHLAGRITNTGDPALNILIHVLDTSAAQGEATVSGGWNSEDIHGNVYSNQPYVAISKYLSTTEGLNKGSYYTEYEADVVDNRPFPSQLAVDLMAMWTGVDQLVIVLYHDSWASLADTTAKRVSVSRQLRLNVASKQAQWDENSKGPVRASGNAATKEITFTGVAAYSDYAKYGTGNLSGYRYSLARCPRTKEAIGQSLSPNNGAAVMRYLGVLTDAAFADPGLRDFSANAPYNFLANYPSIITASMARPKLMSRSALRCVGGFGYGLITGINFDATIPYEFPEGEVTTWAVDQKREKVNSLETGRILTEITADGTVYLSQGFTQGYLDAASSIDINGMGTVDTAVLDRVLIRLNAVAAQVTQSKGTAVHVRTSLYIPRHATKRMAGKAFSSTIVVLDNGDAYNVMAIVVPVWNASVLVDVTVEMVNVSNRTSTKVASVTYAAANSIGPTLAELDDFTYIGGSHCWQVNYPGFSNQPAQSIALPDATSDLVPIRSYGASATNDAGTEFVLPGQLGVCGLESVHDNTYGRSTMTVRSYGRTLASVRGAAKSLAKVIATQAVYGDWNVYISEELPCRMDGVSGMLPKQTINLKDIEALPANKTFYIYVQLIGTTLSYLVTPDVQVTGKRLMLVGTAVTGDTKVAYVTAQKLMAIDGYSFSVATAPNTIPASDGVPNENGVLQWTLT